eukprot:7716463-Alexandrium_andersonii.AAC.1
MPALAKNSIWSNCWKSRKAWHSKRRPRAVAKRSGTPERRTHNAWCSPQLLWLAPRAARSASRALALHREALDGLSLIHI